MTPIHIHYRPPSAPLFRRMVNDLPFVLNDHCVDENLGSSEGWLVVAEPNEFPLPTRIPRSRRALCLNEPSAMNNLPLGYINQFGLLISPYRIAGFQGHWQQTHTGLPWFFGAEWKHGKLLPTLSRTEIRDLPIPPKTKTISVVLSRKVFHAGHRQRLKLLALLKERLGDRLKIYGRGIEEIRDKAEAILPSALHLALENTIEPSYWTEKLSDAFLGYALPVYGGCPDVHRWFPEQSLLTIDPNAPDQAAQTICEALDQDLHSQRFQAICQARSQILEHLTVYHVVIQAVAACRNDSPILAKEEIVRPPKRGGITQRMGRELRRVYHQVTFRSRLQQAG